MDPCKEQNYLGKRTILGCIVNVRSSFTDLHLQYLISSYGVPYPHAEPQQKDLVLVQTVEWYNIGLQLGVEDAELKVLQQNYPRDSEACKREMFSAWLKKTSSPSYQQLVEALRAVGENREANRLCKKYGK